MSVCLIVKYPGSKETTKIDNVPYSCTFAKLKKMIIKINKFEGDAEKVNIVRHGMIPSLESTIGDLSLDGENTTSVFVTGIKSRNKPKPVPEEEKVEQQTPIHQEQPEQIQIQPQWTNVNNNNNAGPKRGGAEASKFAFDKKKIMLIGICVFSLTVLLIAFIYRNKSIPTTKKPKKEKHTHNYGQPSYGKQSRYGPTIAVVIVVLFFIYSLRNIKWTKDIVIESIVQFFKSLLPTWKVDAFANEHHFNLQ